MKDQELRFAGSVPEKYDELMVPLIFRPFAVVLGRRAASFAPRLILETAAGTGVVTKALHQACPDADIVATDLNQPMLDVASQRIASDKVRFMQADALELPFEDSKFDLVVCQFGAMFFPDRVRGHSEARRVLAAGGHYLLAIWDRIERNALTDLAQQALIDYFPDDPPLFMREGPFSYADPLAIESDLHEAGFETVDIETIELRSRAASAKDAAAALCYGTPMGIEVEDREAGCLDRIFERVEQALKPFETEDGVDAPMAAHIVAASR